MKKIILLFCLFLMLSSIHAQQSFILAGEQKLAAIADVTGNGIDDIILTDSSRNQLEISVIISKGDTFQAAKVWAIVRNSNIKLGGVGDLNGDGLSDIILSYKERGIPKMLVLYSTGTAFSQTTDSTPVVITPTIEPIEEPSVSDPYDNDLRELFRKALVPPYFAVNSNASMAEFVSILSRALQPYDIKLIYGSGMLFVNYRNRNHRIPIGGSELHKALVEINKVIASEYEIRYVAVTAGSGKAGFVIRNNTDWRQLERQKEEHTSRNFRILANMPDIFRELTTIEVFDNAYKTLEDLYRFNSEN